jgi:hypothetical protein
MKPENLTPNMVIDEFQRFLAACQALLDHHHDTKFPTLGREVLRVDKGRRFYKMVREELEENGSVRPGSGYVWAFVEIATGDVLRPATFAKPAFHTTPLAGRRGAKELNLFDDDIDEKMTPYGPPYHV